MGNFTKDILNNDLNGTISYADFFHALGYQDQDNIYLRTIDDKKRGDAPHKKDIVLSRFDRILSNLKTENGNGWGVFYVVNGGGQDDNNVKAPRACFIDGDDLTLEEQAERLADFPLDPSIIIRTKKSLHAYWITTDGNKAQFTELQKRLAQHFKSDPVICNPSRVMRLYGFNHCKGEPVEVKLIKFNPKNKYTQHQLHEVLPLLNEQPTTKTAQKTHTGEVIPRGQRHKYVVSRIGYYVGKLADDTSDEVILETVCTDFLQNCQDADTEPMDAFRQKYLKTIQKFRAKKDDPEFRSYCMKAWKAENPGADFDKLGQPWDEVKAAGYRALDKGTTFDEEPTPSATDPEPEAPQDSIDSFLNAILSDRFKPIPTGIKDIDAILGGGLISQELVTLAAAPGMGKTTLMSQILEQMASAGHSCLYFNLEMSREQMIARSLARIGTAKLSSTEILQAYNLDDLQRDAIRESAELYKQKIGNNLIYNPKYFDTEAGAFYECGAKLDNILKAMNQAANNAKKNEQPAPIVCIDYLHLLRGERGEETTETIKRAVESLKDYAIKFNTVVFLISANNRAANRSGRATLDSGRDTSNIEYSADLMLSLNYKESDSAKGENADEVADKIREFRENGEAVPDKYLLYSLRVTKSRFTEAGARAVLRFDGKHSKFMQVEKKFSGKYGDYLTPKTPSEEDNKFLKSIGWA